MEEKDSKKKLSYEELTNVAVQMQQRAMEAEQKLRSIDLTNMRLHYLFEVVRHSNKGAFTPEFIEKCSKEIEEILTIKEEELPNSEV